MDEIFAGCHKNPELMGGELWMQQGSHGNFVPLQHFTQINGNFYDVFLLIL